MKKFAVMLNIVMLAFTALVVATDGAPTEPVYILLTSLLLLLPLMNALLLPAGQFVRLRRALAVCNVLLVAFVVWAIADQYPHPEEEGLMAFTILVVAVPLLSAVLLFRPPGPVESQAASFEPLARNDEESGNFQRGQ